MAGVTIEIPGIGNVEAKNAATEATLKEILKAINDGAGGGYKKGGKPGKEEKDKGGPGGDTKDGGGGKAGGLNSLGKAVGSVIRPIQMVGGGFMALGKSTTSLIQSFANAGDSFTGAASVFSGIPVLGGILSAVAAAADKTLGSYQAATAGGATFGGSMNNFAAAASGAGMTMDKFGALIAQNSEALMTLGGTTEEGAKRFAGMSKEIRSSGIGTQLYGLGMTTEQVNQGMASYLKTYGANGALQGKSTKELAQGAGQYLKELDALAKITGQNRAEIQKEQEARMKDSQFRAATAHLDADQAKMMNNFISQFPKEQQEAVKDMIATGNITSDAAILFNQQMGGTAQEVMKMGQIINSGGKLTQQSYDNAYKGAIAEAKVAAKSEDARTQALYNSQQFGNTYIGLAELAKRDINGKEKALTEQEKAQAAQAAAMEKAKQNIAAVSNSFQMVLANSGLLNLLMEAFTVAADLTMKYLVPAFNLFSAVVTEVGTWMLSLLKPAIETVGNFIMDHVVPAFMDLQPLIETVGGIINDYVLPAFSAIGGFIFDNILPIMAGLGAALLAYGVAKAFTTAQEWLKAGANSAELASRGGLLAALMANISATWSAAAAALGLSAPMLAVVVAVGALVGLFYALYKNGWTLGTAFDAVKDNLERFGMNIMGMIDNLRSKLPAALGGLSDEEAKLRAEEREKRRKELDEKEKDRDKERAATAKERGYETKEEQRAQVHAAVDKKLLAAKSKGVGQQEEANAKDKKAKEEATEIKKDFNDSLALLPAEAQQQKSAFIKNPESKTTAGAEATKKEIEAKAEAKAEEVAKAKKEEDAKKQSAGGAAGGGSKPAPATQESAETLLASLNTKMEQLIKINKGVQDINKDQLAAQRANSNDLFQGIPI